MIEITWRALKPKPGCINHGKHTVVLPRSGIWYCVQTAANGRICGRDNLRWGRGLWSKDVPGRLTASYRRNHA